MSQINEKTNCFVIGCGGIGSYLAHHLDRLIDLKQIREIVREEINAEVPAIVEAKIYPLREKIEQIWNSINEDLVANLTMIEKLSKKVNKLEERIRQLELAK